MPSRQRAAGSRAPAGVRLHVAIVMLLLCGVVAPGLALPASASTLRPHTSGPVVGQGYYLYDQRGGLHGFGNNDSLATLGTPPANLHAPVVGMATTPVGGGYWLADADGEVFTGGDARFFGPIARLHLNQPIVGIAATSDGAGYWLVAADGGIFNLGDARFYGSTGNLHLNQPIVGMAATPDGGGYWLVAADGGIFSYGDARFYGSTGHLHLNRPIVGMVATPDGKGYWFVASDGGIFSYGDAGFHGSSGNLTLDSPIVGMESTADGNGYWLVAKDGGVFNYGDAPFSGSLGGQGVTGVVGIVQEKPLTATGLFIQSPVSDGATYGAENAAVLIVTVSSLAGPGSSGSGSVTITATSASAVTTTACTATLDTQGTGSCSLTPTQLDAGKYLLQAIYRGSADSSPSSALFPLSIDPASTTLMAATPTVLADGYFTFGALLTSNVTGEPLSGQPVTFTLGSESCLGISSDVGVAECAMSVIDPLFTDPPTTSFDVSYEGSVDYAASTATGSIGPFYDGLAQSSLTTAMTAAKAAYDSAHGYDSSDNLANYLNDVIPALGVSDGNTASIDPYYVSVATYKADGQTLATGPADGVIAVIAVYSNFTQTCWFIEDDEQTVSQAVASGAEWWFPAGTMTSALFNQADDSTCRAAYAAGTGLTWTSNGWPL